MNSQTLVASIVIFLTSIASFPVSGTLIAQESGMKIGQPLPSFELKDFQGVPVVSTELKKKPVVIFFMGVECPLVKLYASRMNKLSAKFESNGVQWIGIDSNQQDSLKELEQFAAENETTFALLKDAGNKVADAFMAKRTPEVFVFDASHKLRYHGAIDDQYHYGQQKPKVEKAYLRDALEAIVDNQTPSIETTPPVGCIIGRMMKADETSEVTYTNQISRIIQENCVHCHRPGEIAPFSLTDYDEVVGWAEMIQEVVADRRMPPWHADPKHGVFKNDIRLSDKELSDIKKWVDAGAPEGNPDDLLQPIEFVEGWRIGTPDVIIPMNDKPYKVKATGTIPYEHFVVDPGFKEDKYISAAECRIGNRAVVHHIIVAVNRCGLKRRVHGEIPSEWLTATAPGADPLILPDGYAKVIPAGAKLVFQMHYTPNGTAQTDLSSVGFKFVDKSEVKKLVGTVEVSNENFKIPPGADNHKVKAVFQFPREALMLSLFPHMHLRGKSFCYTAKYPDGKSEILLNVPKFDFNWQLGYEFAEPKLIPKGTILECVAHFDNSESNFSNPDPSKTIRWGDQTWDEMMIGYFNVADANQDLTKD